MSNSTENEDAPVIEDDSTGEPDAPESNDAGEVEKLNKAAELIAKVATEGEKSGFGVDAVAEAAYFFRSSKLTLPFRLAWSAAPSLFQREMVGTNQSAIGEFFMRYLPMMNPRAYNFPGLFIAALAKVGVVEFKLNGDEEKTMEKELGENPSDAAKTAYKAKVEESLIDGIIHPYQGVSKIITGPLGAIVSTVQPELAPAVAVAKAGDIVEGARDGYFVQVRERVHALELETAQKKDAAEAEKIAVPKEVVQEHNAVANADPEAHIPPLPESN